MTPIYMGKDICCTESLTCQDPETAIMNLRDVLKIALQVPNPEVQNAVAVLCREWENSSKTPEVALSIMEKIRKSAYYATLIRNMDTAGLPA